jgi:hypothetical protein
MEPLWDLVIRAKRVGAMLPILERVLDRGRTGGQTIPHRPDPTAEADRDVAAGARLSAG